MQCFLTLEVLIPNSLHSSSLLNCKLSFLQPASDPQTQTHLSLTYFPLLLLLLAFPQHPISSLREVELDLSITLASTLGLLSVH